MQLELTELEHGAVSAAFYRQLKFERANIHAT